MKLRLKRKWMVPVAALVLTLSIGTAAFAATGSFSTDTSAAATSTSAAATATAPAASSTDTSTPSATKDSDTSKPWGQQRSDETLLTGDVLAQVQAAAVAKAGTGATVVRAETDADGNAKYEVHMVKADGTGFTVYVDESYNAVSVQEGCQGGGHKGGANDNDADDAAGSTSTSAAPSTTN